MSVPPLQAGLGPWQRDRSSSKYERPKNLSDFPPQIFGCGGGQEQRGAKGAAVAAERLQIPSPATKKKGRAELQRGLKLFGCGGGI